jgi:hypothetical protein
MLRAAAWRPPAGCHLRPSAVVMGWEELHGFKHLQHACMQHQRQQGQQGAAAGKMDPLASDAARALDAATCRRLTPGDDPASAAVSSDMLQLRRGCQRCGWPAPACLPSTLAASRCVRTDATCGTPAPPTILRVWVPEQACESGLRPSEIPAGSARGRIMQCTRNPPATDGT